MRSRGRNPCFVILRVLSADKLSALRPVRVPQTVKVGGQTPSKLQPLWREMLSHDNSKRKSPWPGLGCRVLAQARLGPAKGRRGFGAKRPKSVLTLSLTPGQETSVWFGGWLHSGRNSISAFQFRAQTEPSEWRTGQGGACRCSRPSPQHARPEPASPGLRLLGAS